MKFGDFCKLNDRSWKEFCDIFDSNLIIENRFLFLGQIEYPDSPQKYRTALATVDQNSVKFDKMCVNTSVIYELNNKHSDQKYMTRHYVPWRDFDSLIFRFEFIDYFNNHHCVFKDYNIIPNNHKLIVPQITTTFSVYDDVVPFMQQIIKQDGGKCLICNDFNPWMNGDGFCWSCKTDPRNQFKIQNILNTIQQ